MSISYLDEGKTVACDHQKPVIQFTFNNRSGVVKPMEVTLDALHSNFDSVTLDGVYRDIVEDKHGIPNANSSPRALDVRFIDFPIVIKNRDSLEKMLQALDGSQQNVEQERKLLPLQIAIKMSEIAELVADGKVKPHQNGMSLVIFEATNPFNNKLHVGWRFEKTGVSAGDKIHIDHGVGISKNQDGTVAWAHPFMGKDIAQWPADRRRKEIRGVILKKDGSMEIGLLSFDPNGQASNVPTFLLNHSPVGLSELSDISMISPLPREEHLPNLPATNMSVGDKVLAWYLESLRSEDHHNFDIGEVEDSSHNRRYQGYNGPMLRGSPTTEYKHYLPIDVITDLSLLKPYQTCITEAKAALKEKVFEVKADVLKAAISSPTLDM